MDSSQKQSSYLWHGFNRTFSTAVATLSRKPTCKGRQSVKWFGATSSPNANSQAEIESRVALGPVTWPRALTVLMGRSCFMILAQALVALVFLRRGRESRWNAAALGWTVYAKRVDRLRPWGDGSDSRALYLEVWMTL